MKPEDWTKPSFYLFYLAFAIGVVVTAPRALWRKITGRTR
jgi:hypothetical protein